MQFLQNLIKPDASVAKSEVTAVSLHRSSFLLFSLTGSTSGTGGDSP
jgi:hypothetical protein